jgi:hypothetical protein
MICRGGLRVVVTELLVDEMKLVVFSLFLAIACISNLYSALLVKAKL